jgi:Xaa-Pro aminopeptidase
MTERTMNEVNVPRLPLSERDRRHSNVHAAMRKAGIDVLVLPANHSRWDQMMADSRYLTTIGGYGTETLTIMPVEGGVTAGVFNRAAWWGRAQDWISDVRDCTNDWGRLVVDRLRELGFAKTGCIGISGLGWLQRAPDGIVPYATVMTIKEAFPLATIVDASNLMQQIRAVKSDIEVDLMRRSLGIIETMLDAATAQARPGIREKDIYATMIGTMLAADGELPSMLIFGTGPAGSHSQFVPTNRVLEPGDVLSGEIEGRYCGYSGQIIHPISLGPQSADYVDLLKTATTCLLAIAENMRPGRTMGDLMDVYETTLKGAGADFEFSHPMMHARGLGDEFPYQTKGVNIDKFRAIELVSGMTFVVKPRVRSSRSKLAAQMGETIVVRPQGGQRLGKRPLELRIV